MSEKMLDLNALRVSSLKSEEGAPKESDSKRAVSTRDQFEALPIEEQEKLAKEGDYFDEAGNPDVETYKKENYSSGLDINKLRAEFGSKS